MGKGFSGMPSMLYLRKYSVLIIWKWPHRTIMQMVQHYLFYNSKFLLFFYSSISIIMTDVLQGKIQQQCKIFLFPKRIPFLFLNLFGWSKSSGHDLTLRKCSGGLRIYCAKIQIYPVTCEIWRNFSAFLVVLVLLLNTAIHFCLFFSKLDTIQGLLWDFELKGSKPPGEE